MRRAARPCEAHREIYKKLVLGFFKVFLLPQKTSAYGKEKKSPSGGLLKELNKQQLMCFISSPSLSLATFRDKLLAPILVERVSGTYGNYIVRQHIVSILRSSGWHIDLDTFYSTTPDGIVEFTNIIATLDPTRKRRLVLACHYDSKKLVNFIGATDSAVSCAILLDIAISLKQQLDNLKSRADDITLQLIFFDGEEAIRDWTSTDSLYGSRHLAMRMSNTIIQGQRSLTELQAIDMMVLLDLIGAETLQFQNYFQQTTGSYYNRLRTIDYELMKLTNDRSWPLFTSSVTPSYIMDDHVPFLQLGVPILHLISYPFPGVWHTSHDNEENLDYPTVQHMRNIMKVFVVEYLHLKQINCQETSIFHLIL
ncbi:unnamed protein product [Didymodactylos carnosus]|uniref:Glutaminyl-peptide cyclotransferase n=1 Tax=Didymodactylos carnosus TaxID=1234261 RepID=A0A813WAW3_9BILA|nr:unnamed protein product [Didymodactylos carnosus]CAF1069762.1 unnamed protein product [Didymodactylos carnosus]CAF3643003.1 unnamed protein product [Didymodactylos carnosus]CAF3834313.1 unnamed protein product [Didymodactylos carnosus]